jgi:propanol-preferring alcohol dehydrogenase
MRAMVLEKQAPVEQAPLELRGVPDPEPGAGELVIAVEACAVCRTDLHVVEGDLPPHRLPLVPGHEIVGTVARCGEGVEAFAPGDAVCLPWLYWTCGECRYCGRGQENLCEGASFTGWDVDGGYAEQVLTQAAFTHPLPGGMTAVQAAPLLCAGVIGFRALRLAGAQEAQRLGLYGFGAAAHIAIQVARHWGCQVFVFTRTESHRRHAEELGAAWTGRAEEDAPAPLDAAVIFAPAGELVPEALRALDKGGTLALAGIHMSPIPTMDYGLLYQERVVRSVANSTTADVRDLLRVAAEAPVTTQTTVFPLEQANEALRRVKESAIDGAAVLEPTVAGPPAVR